MFFFCDQSYMIVKIKSCYAKNIRFNQKGRDNVMLENNTDRLFWTITSILVATMLMVIMVKAYPKLANHILRPYTQDTAYNITNPNNRPVPKQPQAYVVDKSKIPYTAASDQVSKDYE